MIGIFSKSPDEVFLKKLGLPFQLIDVGSNVAEIEGLFLDWVPPSQEKDFIYQAQLVERYIKKIPIVIYDRHFSVTHQEASWMKKFKTFLFEPAILTERTGFVYLPEWTSYYSVLDTENRPYNVIDISDNLEYKIESFEKWYMEYARLFPDKKVAYYTKELKNFKKEDYKKSNLIFIEGEVLPDYTVADFTVINSPKSLCKVGYLNPVYFIAMNQGCIPLLPYENRFFHVIFKDLIIRDTKEMDFYIGLYNKVNVPIIEELFDNIKKYFPEFTVEYASDIVRKCYE